MRLQRTCLGSGHPGHVMVSVMALTEPRLTDFPQLHYLQSLLHSFTQSITGSFKANPQRVEAASPIDYLK